LNVCLIANLGHLHFLEIIYNNQGPGNLNACLIGSFFCRICTLLCQEMKHIETSWNVDDYLSIATIS
jgi:hypothetical protein